MRTYPYRTYAEIDLNNLQHNLRQIRAFVGEACRIMFVVKADAYGHGTPMCAKYSEPFVDWYAAATLDEALSIRRAGVKKPILLFGILQDRDIAAAANARITASVGSVRYAGRLAAALDRQGLEMDCHLEFNTGMNRTGIFTREDCIAQAAETARSIYAIPALHVTGCYMHFSCGDNHDPADAAFTERQHRAFGQVLHALERGGYAPGLRHCVSTGPLLLHPDWKMDMVRVGMLGYGYSISPETAAQLDLHPIMRWCAKIADIEELDAGESVSYARLYTTSGKERIAVISVGYADGYNRCYTNRAPMVIRGKPVTECGKICMDFAMANVTAIPDAAIGDDVLLLGEDGAHMVCADSLSALMEYGVNGWTTCQITARVPRIYVLDGEVVGIRTQYAAGPEGCGLGSMEGS